MPNDDGAYKATKTSMTMRVHSSPLDSPANDKMAIGLHIDDGQMVFTYYMSASDAYELSCALGVHCDRVWQYRREHETQEQLDARVDAELERARKAEL